MRIINRALTRELTTSTLAVTFIFVALFMVVSLVKILAKAAAGSFPVTLVFTMLGLQTIEVLSLMLPLAFYIGLLLTLGRWYRDNEMTVLSACGVSLTQMLRPVFIMVLGFALVVTALSMYLAPLAARLMAETKRDETARYQLAALTAGVFNEISPSASLSDGGVYYVEGLSDDGIMQRVFVATRHLGRQGVLIARTAREHIDPDTGDRFLILENGVRYGGAPGEADYRMIRFERYGIRVELPVPTLRFTPFNAMPTRQLLREPSLPAIAEWHWRLAKPLVLVALALFGLVFAYTNPRQGRYAGLFVAIMAYFLYSNLLGVGDAMLKRGRVPAALGLWWVHALFIVIGVVLLWRRIHHRPMFPSLPARLRGRRP
jgi:lipopolysaccharide export system permease protein